MTNIEQSIGEFLLENKDEISKLVDITKNDLIQDKKHYTGPFEVVFPEIKIEKINEALIQEISKNIGINEMEIRNIIDEEFITRFLGKEVYNLK